MREFLGLVTAGGLFFMAALPGTGNYELRSYGFGSGGTAESGTSNYSLEGLAGEISALDVSTDTYGMRGGLFGTQLASLPEAPEFSNPDDWYNKLALTIKPTGNPSDTTFAVAVSSDNFATTRYVQSDDTIGDALGPEDFRTYEEWGGDSGMEVIGLQPDTEYKVKVKARQGQFSETGFGSEAAAQTSVPSLVFDIDISANDEESSPPYSLEFGQVPPGTVTDSPNLIWLDIGSNAESGALVYVVSENDGLLSSSTGYTISPATGDLGALEEGIGAQSTFASQSSGSTLTPQAPYDGEEDAIGAIDGQFRQMLASDGPLSEGRAAFLLKLKTKPLTPAAPDYTDIYTIIATAAF